MYKSPPCSPQEEAEGPGDNNRRDSDGSGSEKVSSMESIGR